MLEKCIKTRLKSGATVELKGLKFKRSNFALFHVIFCAKAKITLRMSFFLAEYYEMMKNSIFSLNLTFHASGFKLLSLIVGSECERCNLLNKQMEAKIR